MSESSAFDATGSEAGMPRARGEDDGVLSHNLDDETVVYDLARHRAGSLNTTAATIWRWCDGRASVQSMAQRLADEHAIPTEEAATVVEPALDRLGKAHLLHAQPAVAARPAISRRDLARRLATIGVALALPAIVTVVSPTAVSAQSVVCAGTCTRIGNSNNYISNCSPSCVCPSLGVNGRGPCIPA